MSNVSSSVGTNQIKGDLYMGQFANGCSAEDMLRSSLGRVEFSSPEETPWQAIRCLTEAQASAIGLPHGLLISHRASWHSASVLMPTNDAIHRLEQAWTVAEAMNHRPLVFACTNAREAQSLTRDNEARDRRYLSGVRTIDGFHVYCGSIDAAVNRALAYAPYADVVCYRASKFDLAEARYFASAIRDAFPNKPLGMGLSLPGELNVAGRSEKLLQLGYSYYFLTFSGQVFFPAFPEDRPWALFDDGAESNATIDLTEVQCFHAHEPNSA